jgi:putative proteasome-type protease
VTFCLGMRTADGLLAIADTRITSGTEASVAKKISVHQHQGAAMFILTSGLRSLRDKAITYFDERLQQDGTDLDKMYKAANALADEIRRVRTEDQRWLIESGLAFDLHLILGGQLRNDDTHHLFLIYPEGNWIEVGTATPYVIIGETRYGKPLLDRVWRHGAPLEQALRDGLLSFDATRTSATDVDPPADVVLYRRGSHTMHEMRLTEQDLQPLARFWNDEIRAAVNRASAVVDPLFRRLEVAPPALRVLDGDAGPSADAAHADDPSDPAIAGG